MGTNGRPSPWARAVVHTPHMDLSVIITDAGGEDSTATLSAAAGDLGQRGWTGVLSVAPSGLLPNVQSAEVATVQEELEVQLRVDGGELDGHVALVRFLLLTEDGPAVEGLTGFAAPA